MVALVTISIRMRACGALVNVFMGSCVCSHLYMPGR